VRSRSVGVLGTLLVLVLASAAPPADARAASLYGIRMVEDDPIVGVDVVRVPPENHACKGTEFTMVFQAAEHNFEAPSTPIFGAAIELSDGKGGSKRQWTDAAGMATFTWPAKEDGQIDFTVRADKEGYLPGEPETFWISVEPCRWELSVDYQEEYAFAEEVSMIIGAEVNWTANVTMAGTGSSSGKAPVEFDGGAGTYSVYAGDAMPGPVHISLDPPVNGMYDIAWEGWVDGGMLYLREKSVDATFPKMAFIKVRDDTGNIKVNYKPPAPWVVTDGDMLKANGVRFMKFALSGGTVSRSSGPPSFVSTPTRTAWSLRVTVKEVKEGAP
jgi:hypothetical protein